MDDRFAYVNTLTGWAIIEKTDEKPTQYTILCNGKVRAVRDTLRSAKRYIRKNKGVPPPKPYWEHQVVHREPDEDLEPPQPTETRSTEDQQ